jgi:hypothetical protein
MNYSSKPPSLSAAMNTWAKQWFPLVIVLHCLWTIWAFTEPTVMMFTDVENRDYTFDRTKFGSYFGRVLPIGGSDGPKGIFGFIRIIPHFLIVLFFIVIKLMKSVVGQLL